MGKVDQGFLVLWAARHLYGGRLSYIGFGGEGLQVRDVLHVADLYDLIRMSDRRHRSPSGAVHNVGGGTGAQRVSRRADGDLPRAHRPQHAIASDAAHDRRRRAVLRHRQHGNHRGHGLGAGSQPVDTVLDDVLRVAARASQPRSNPSLGRGARRRGTGGVLTMSVVLITGASGLIGSEAALFFSAKGFDIVGVDNDMRRYFFGDDGSTAWRRDAARAGPARLPARSPPTSATKRAMDRAVLRRYGRDIALVIHAAAQPSHDWAAREPITDFTVNANGTLIAARDDAASLPGRAVHLHEHEQGLRRHAEPAAARRARDALGGGRRPPVRRPRHRRNDEHRPARCTACSAHRRSRRT